MLDEALVWDGAQVPGTVASAIGPEELDRHDRYDASDWWYRCSVPGPEAAGGPSAVENGQRVQLRFDGLATLAEVWFNGQAVLESSNMFCGYHVDVTDLVQADNELVIVFRSLDEALSETPLRGGRPRA